MKTIHGLNTEDGSFIHDRKMPLWLRFIVNSVVLCLTPWYTFLLFIARIKTKQVAHRYKFSICAIFKDESLMLKEWIEFHLVIGVEHFYLYNNNSTDDFAKILQPYVDNGIVTLIDWPYPPPSQFPAYSHFYQNYRDETNWVAFIDLDEFIVMHNDVSICDWIEKYDHSPNVICYWKQFGTSGHLNHDNSKLVTEQYTVCWNKLFNIGKTFVNTRFDVYSFSAKHLHALPSSVSLLGVRFMIPPINEFCKFIRYKSNRIGLLRTKNDITIQINHYGTRAYNDYLHRRLARGDVNNHIRDLSTFYWTEQYNKSCDYTIFRFLIELKLRLKLE